MFSCAETFGNFRGMCALTFAQDEDDVSNAVVEGRPPITVTASDQESRVNGEDERRQ